MNRVVELCFGEDVAFFDVQSTELFAPASGTQAIG